MLSSRAFWRPAARPIVSLTKFLNITDKVTDSFVLSKEQMPPGHKGLLAATSYIIDRLEYMASTFMERNLTDKHASVGYFVEFEHKRWAMVGDKVKIEAQVTKVDDRKATFDIVITDNATGDLIGTGVHGRALIRFD
jgi:predicted thioesterase